MIKIEEIVVVEGKYDKIKLESILDTLIVQTNGFSIRKDKEKLEFIRRLATERGVLILTDSDHAGFMIRSYLSGALPKEKVKHAYIPDIYGKEKRKDKHSKEGKLGVEGIDTATIVSALERAGVLSIKNQNSGKEITNSDLFNDGFSGGQNSKAKKKMLLEKFILPEFLSTNGLLKVLNFTITYEEYRKTVTQINEEKR